METWRRYTALVSVVIEATVLAGALYGWASLEYVFENNGLYLDKCVGLNSTSRTRENASTSTAILEMMPQSENDGCLDQKIALSNTYTVGLALFGLCSIPVGYFFDKFGLRTTRTVIALIGLLSYVELAMVSPGNEWLLFTGVTGIGLSCYALLLTSYHAALLSKSPSTVAGIITAGMDTSFAFQGVKIAQDHGTHAAYSLLFIGAFWILVLFSSWFLVPPFKATSEDKEIIVANKQAGKEEAYELNRNVRKIKVKEPIDIEDNNSYSISHQDHSKYFKSMSFILFVYWFQAINLRVNMMNNVFNTLVTDIVHGDTNKVSYYTNVLAYCDLAEILPCILVGLLTDWMMSKTGSTPGGRNLALIPAVTVSSLLAIAMTIAMFTTHEAAIYVSIIAFDLTKPITYTSAASYISTKFPEELFGMAYGLTYTLEGVLVFLMIPLFQWMKSARSFDPVNAFLLATLIVSLALPVNLYYNWWEERRGDPEKRPLMANSLNSQEKMLVSKNDN